eukprot:CAMPEP_0198605718 /NCGR_PEP_ID=MMETSP1462-20131121/154534_1 /TAXON_ID=1333877 /ORGANISM="Brandtodinium nutriculum, Strain RCC3387" /LENGTH=531 /DNA_ID=CAMNT_0044337521 /DNA_START=125 /DNA_END=1716 /DNA_ORIENTATION=-
MARLVALASCSAAGAAAFSPIVNDAPAALGAGPSAIPVQAVAVAADDASAASAPAVAPASFSAAGASALAAGAVASFAAAGRLAGRRTSRLARRAGVVEFVDGKARFVVDEAAKAAAAEAAMAGAFRVENELGVQAPLGFWDPAGFCDGCTELEFKRFRSCELKHGRLSMLATIGYIQPFYGKLGGFLSPSAGLKFADMPLGFAAASKVPSGGWIQILLLAALCEFGLGIEEWKERAGGDYGKGFLGLFGPVMDPEKKRRSLNAEIANGRLAMVAITGMFVQEGVFGTTDMWFGPAALARRAGVVEFVDGKARFVVDEAAKAAAAEAAMAGVFRVENELGVQAPLGFWDPAGFCDGCTELEFKRFRSCELKHGRLSMLATIGYIQPFYGKLGGFLSPSAGLKFADMPLGFAAASKVPSGGWIQILLLAALCEFGLGIEEWKERAGGDYGKGFLGLFGPVMDPEKKRRSLNAEIANGRLAMVAITGMFVQEGVFGTTDMWFGPAALARRAGVVEFVDGKARFVVDEATKAAA